MPKTAVAIRHVHFEDLGTFRPHIEAAGYSFQYCDAGVHDIRTIQSEEVDLLIILGGPIGASEDDKYLFLRHELTLLEQRLAAGKPTLGICLGAQLMARALGSQVFPGPAKEIGWAPVALTDAGRLSALRHFDHISVLHWHGDTFDLPIGAERLASTNICHNQAFCFGRSVLAIQFHPEADGQDFERWLIGHTVEIADAGLSIANLRADTERYARTAARSGQLCILEWLESLNGSELP